MAKFQIGDIVQLKSGGPKMTVKQVFPDGVVSCHWFSGTKLSSGIFSAETLVVAEGPGDNRTGKNKA
ncbi:uncharacterized protein YodC (DUF2158 family) [Longimicrobium terrae]|uniref:Uncharacterized protein YodC (DUF2158 family) n=2 Tax=Longimicrobium terrae TaxID=1639882 RepID=A0A841H787_9BACT|nr:DUF2158 domain-containing protein [Longimicrobium terrae]MBB4639476.1 uncharacterized protein YodC (DUF2158 family) [Longimicrobium terrae]MBB6073848.1 uncharacterized protein YodC (DUF2158 family) [Longimicrobium terrae]NNC32524.1 DUF2158 domain-containing protein [Longimicrobium terrae]